MSRRGSVKHQHLSGKTDEYIYKALGKSQIRLLELYSGPTDARLRGSLHAVRLPVSVKGTDTESLPTYEALSYHWGEVPDKSQERTINILENDEWYHVKIRPNLAGALRRLRHLHDPRLIWVDALCINQHPKADELDERKVYVPRMDEIYNKAKYVCIWLGEEGDDSRAAIQFAEHIQDFNPVDGFIKDAAGAKSLASFAALLRRPWFSRRWIVQELAVARKAILYCGDAEIPWSTFSGAISLLVSKHVDLKRIFRSSSAFNHNPDYLGAIEQLGAVQLVYAEANFFRKSEEGNILAYRHSLEDVISTLTTFEAHDPRDIIYAVLSLSNDAIRRQWTKDMSQESLLDPDDTSDDMLDPTKHRSHSVPGLLELSQENFIDIDIKYQSSAFEVYKDFLKLAISKSGSIDIICRPWAAEDPDMAEDYPSWIPKKIGAPFGLRSNRAYSRVRADLLVGTHRAGHGTYSASSDLRARWDYRDYPPLSKSLVVRGFVLDSVHKKLTPAMGGVIPAEWPAEWEALPKLKRPPGSFWRTLVADCSAQGEKPAPYYYSRAYDYAFEQRVQRADFDTREMIRDIHCPSEVQEYLERVQAVTWRRRFVVSKDRILIGLVPYETKKSDLICILAGCSVPVVLRRFETEEAKTKEQRPSSRSSQEVDDKEKRPRSSSSQNHEKVSEHLENGNVNQQENTNDKEVDVPAPTESTDQTMTDLSGLPRYYYKFIGECYIHGMMDGEAMALLGRGSVEEEYEPKQGTKQAFWLR